MTSLHEYTQQSVYSDPGRYAGLYDALPHDLPGIAAVTRNVLIHFRAGGIQFTGDRLAEIDHRWIEDLLATDQRRNGRPLADPREPHDHVVGCCRDWALLTVSVLRHQGVPARSRIGFASYFDPAFHFDHVVAEYWDGTRWVWADPQLDPAEPRTFEVLDIPHDADAPEPLFWSAAQVWTAYRRGSIDPELFGVAPWLDLKGPWFIRNYVLLELAHRQRDELLLWDSWGAMSDRLDADVPLVDEISALLLAADRGAEEAEKELADRYRTDPRLRPGTEVLTFSPTGTTAPTSLVRA